MPFGFHKMLLPLLAGIGLPLLACAAQSGEPAPSAEIAVIGSEHLKLEQLPPKAHADLAAAQRRYEQQRRQLELDYLRGRHTLIDTQVGQYLDQQLLNREAQASGKTPDELLAALPVAPVSETDTRAFYDGHKQQINQPYDQVNVKILDFLTKQATTEARRNYFDGLRAKYAARVTVEPLRQQVAATGPARGPTQAPVTIIEFADFQCPYCGQMAPALKKVLETYPNQVRLVFRHMPLKDIHPNALHAAEAAVCAAEQGKFWEMHDALFADQAALGLVDLNKVAEKLKLKSAPFQECLSANATTAAIDADSQAAAEAGVNGTPGLFINGRFYDGAQPFERLASVIDDELKRQGLSLPAARKAAGKAATSSGA